MCPLHHSNLVRLYGGVWNEGADKLCIVLELCANGSLDGFLRLRTATSWNQLGYGLALGASNGLRYLHHELKQPLIHRDIKPDNIMVGVEVVAKLADFGESTSFDAQQAKLKEEDDDFDGALTMTMVGTSLYCAPEITLGERYNESVDTFSFSLVLISLIVGEVDFVIKSQTNGWPQLAYIKGWRPRIPGQVDVDHPGLVRLVEAMWQTDFRGRPAMRDVVATLVNLVPSDQGEIAVELASLKATQSTGVFLRDDEEIAKAREQHQSSSKSFAVFLSHHKQACAAEARLVKQAYEALLGVECFLGAFDECSRSLSSLHFALF